MAQQLHLLPGTLCTKALWHALQPYLDPNLELVYLDIPQHKNINQLTQYYAEQLPHKPINLIGFSLGGYLASAFAAKYPERMNKLMIIANSPTSLPAEELRQRSRNLALIRTHGFKQLSKNAVCKLLDRTNHQKDLIALIQKMSFELGEPEVLSQYQYTTERTDLAQAMAQFQFQTHIYYSENDELIDPQWFTALKQSSPALTLLPTSGSGHMLPLEKPRECAAYINSWAEASPPL